MEDISTDYEERGIFFKQSKIISISSQLMVPDVGFVYNINPRKGISTAIGIGDTHSCYMTFTVDNPSVTLDSLVKIREDMVRVHVLAADAMLKKVEYMRTRQQREDLEDNPKRAYDSSHIMLQINDNTIDAEKNAHDSYLKARAEFDSQYVNLISQIRDTGIYVFRWTTYDQSSRRTVLGMIFSSFSSDKSLFNGFALVGGLRTSMLFAGKDIVAFGDSGLPLNSKWKKEVTISTFAVQVRQLLYVSGADMEHEFSAHLKASARQLQNVGKTLKELDRVEFEYYNKSLASLFNIGITGGMKKEKHPISWNDVVSCQDGDKGPLSESQGWQTVLTTVTRLDSLQKMFR